MIVGIVNARYEFLIRLRVRGATGQEQELEAILDTGFTGSLTLPPAVIATLGLPWVSSEDATLANGAVEQFDIYAATVIWDGVARSILVQAIDATVLLGMELLIGYELRAQVTSGGLVQIEAIP
jgi:clan AA aspartic protease